MRKKCRFYGLEKVYNRVNREALWQVLRMYDMGVKLSNGIKCMYAKSLACVGVKWGEVTWFYVASWKRIFEWTFCSGVGREV